MSAPGPVVPNQPSGAAAADGLSAAVLRAALSGQIEPVPVTWTYRQGLFLVALATVLLPVLYLGVVALAGWAVYLHVVHDGWILTSGRFGLWRAIGFFGPIVAGGVVVFFLLKPLLARPARRHADVEVGAAEHPLLFELVGGVCRAVGAPTPPA